MSTTTDHRPSPSQPPQVPLLLIPFLPNDVAVNILSRIPRSHHPTLSLVSKSFRCLLSSPLIFTSRSLLNFSESFLYLSLRIPNSDPSIHWFTLYQPKKDKAFLVPVTPTPTPLMGSAFAVVGPRIYVIGGSFNDVPSSHVWVLDCRFHTWEAAPSMRISREFAASGVVDGKVYVIGGCVVDTCARSRCWAEVFDPVSGRWDPVESSGGEAGLVREKWMHASAVVGGKIYAMADRGGVVYEPRTRRWESVGSELDMGWRGRACVVCGVLFCYDYLGKIRGFDMGKEERVGREWKELMGVEKELPRFLCGATMANFGGNLVVVWEANAGGNGKETEIWCAEIEVEVVKGVVEVEELWGKILWCGVIHKVPARLRMGIIGLIQKPSELHLLSAIQAIARALLGVHEGFTAVYNITMAGSGGRVASTVAVGIECLDLVLEYVSSRK